MVEIEIDGQKIAVEEGSTIIEAADQAGIYIPRFCYHRKLSIAANCRMCLVEVEKARKPVPACATPISPDMKVFTKSPQALEAQRTVMQFLLINHPLDCPICDQGGACELQDLAMGYGDAKSYFGEGKRSVYSDSIGSLIETEMTRCIHCTRCVRFGEEVAGLRELGAVGRGEHMEIGTYVQHFVSSELSGNVIDLCPVGALTAKPSRYAARGWEMTEHPYVAPHDCVGSNTYLHTRGQEYAPQRTVMRVVPRENESINETWLSDRDRFGYLGLQHADRIMKPRMKKNGQWVEVEWQRALLEIIDRTQAICQQQGANQLAALISPNSTLETSYVAQQWLRALGCHNIDHRFRQHDFRDQSAMPLHPGLGLKIADIETLDAVLLLGSHVRMEQPLLAHRINKAYQDGARVMAINPADYPHVFTVADKIITHDIREGLAKLAKVLVDRAGEKVPALDSVITDHIAEAIADQLQQHQQSAGIFLGEHALHHPHAADIRALVALIQRLTGAKVSELTTGANTAGAWLAGAVPHRGAAGATLETAGLDAKMLLTTDPVRAYFLVNMEPELDTAYPAAALAALQQAGLVVCLTPFATDTMEAYADFILPITPFSETAGTYINAEGQWQSTSAVSVPTGEAKPAWKIFRVLANLMEIPGFEYQTAHEIRDLLQQQVGELSEHDLAKPSSEHTPLSNLHGQVDTNTLNRLAPWPIYRVDSLVRRADALQATELDAEPSVGINAATAVALGFNPEQDQGQAITVHQDDQTLSLPLRIDNHLADHVVHLPSGLAETSGFGSSMMPITLQRGSA